MKRRIRVLSILVQWVFLTFPLMASSYSDRTSNLRLDLALYDVPYNNSFGRNPLIDPSMQQSLSISKSFINGQNYLIGDYFEDSNRKIPWYGKLAIVASDIFLAFLPGNDVWLHEEWHRAVMGHRNINSYNGVLTLGSFGSVPVNQVQDADLIRLKAEHPEDMVRLSSAGVEAEEILIYELAKDSFYYEKHPWNYGSMWFATLSAISYSSTCISAKDSNNPNEGIESQTEEERDFTGLDCTAWVYDLFRPDEPYEARGVLTSGGIDRQRFFSDLTDREKAFLEESSQLAYVSLINPILYGYDRFTLKNIKYNFMLQHFMTSFGYLIDLRLFAEYRGQAYYLTIHNHRSPERYFPGLSVEYPGIEPFSGLALSFDVNASVWDQPYKLRFDQSSSRTGGLISVKARYHMHQTWQPYVSAAIKTEGWAAGYVDQSASSRVIAGMMASF